MANAIDQAFTLGATELGQAKIAEGMLALTHAPGFASNEYGLWAVLDNQLINGQITALANAAGLPVSNSASQVNQQAAAALGQLSGTGFEQIYLNTQITLQEQTINLFQTEVQQGSDPALVAYAHAALPVMQAQFVQAAFLYANIAGLPPTIAIPNRAI